ncbi:MAG: hypothetical protein BroJett042_03720 [Bacteroidota bacterium]|nr:MAG: hypothetical protein BroJett042_03720 [Bacteroidota bacterium]
MKNTLSVHKLKSSIKSTSLLFICLVLLSNIAFSQGVQLKELISICNKDIGFVDDLLTKKNFTFLGERKSDNNDLSEYSWRHFENFTLIVSVYRSPNPDIKIDGSGYFFEGVGILNSLKAECIALGYKKTESYTEDDIFYSIYKNDKLK